VPLLQAEVGAAASSGGGELVSDAEATATTAMLLMGAVLQNDDHRSYIRPRQELTVLRAASPELQ
jgi:hypothetical protein